LYIANLFSIYNPQSNNLYENIDQIIRQSSYQILKHVIDSNKKTIKSIFSKSDYIVLAWGNAPENFHEFLYYNRVAEILECISAIASKEVFIFKHNNNRQKCNLSLTKIGNPGHPINGGIISLIKVEIDLYKGIFYIRAYYGI
jgi:hypothetical protein